MAQTNEDPPFPKRQKLDLDRISKLPDSLLCHILSFLSTKEAVATSIFSKRWRFLWTWLTNLDFKDEEIQVSKKIFCRKVYRVLLLRRHDIPIKRFCLKWDSYQESLSFHVGSWVRAAIAREVEELDIDLENSFIDIPPSLFSHKPMVVLKLRAVDSVLDVPSSAHFPNLKTLFLSDIEFKDRDSARNLFSACPVLEELELDLVQIYCFKKFEFPSYCCVRDGSICFSSTLVTLKLLYRIELNVVAGGISFPRLESLKFVDILYKDDNSIRNLFSGCPVIRNFTVLRTRFDNACCYEITSQTLRDLTVEFFNEDGQVPNDRTLRLNTPSVKYLTLTDKECSQYLHFGKMDSLVEATVSHLPCHTNHGRVQIDFLEAVRNVTYLVFPAYVMKPFCNAKNFDKFPEFHNVVNLKITKFGGLWGLLPHALQKLPHLEHLILEKESDIDAMPNEACWTPPQQPSQVPKCLIFHLTTFCVLKFQGLDEEMEFVEYILKNSMVLEMVTLSFLKSELEIRSSILQKLATFKRGSKNCQLKFDQDF